MTRPLVGASALGIAQAAYEWTLEYLDGQSEGGTPLLQTQRIQQALADVATEIEAARLLVQRASWMGRNGIPMSGGQGSMSKLKAGDVTMWATTTLMDLVGPYAQTTDCPLEKWFRDAKIYQLFEGTAEIQRLVISRMQAASTPSASATAAEVAAKAMNGDAEGAPSPRRSRSPPSRPTAPGHLKLGGVHAHAHAHGHGLDARRADTRRRMWIALAINVGMLVAEAVGGFITGSLALLADAGHLLSDVGAIALALTAASLAARPGGARRTFGYQRAEVLAALVNGLRWSRSRSRSRSRRSAASPIRRSSTAAASWRSASFGLAGNVAATIVLAGGRARGHQPRGRAAPLLRRRARLARRHRRRRGRPHRRLGAGGPVASLLIAALSSPRPGA